MNDSLLPYYDRELEFLRKMGAEFAEAHPKIAGRLRLAKEGADDPHVARLLEAFAYLNARTRRKLDDDFPEITAAMLGVLYPNYLAPIPSAAIVQFSLDRGQSELTSGYTIAAGTPIETEPVDGEPCRFRTCYPVTLWPITLISADLKGQPFTAPPGAGSPNAVAAVRLVLETISADVQFAQLQCDSLRFHLMGGSRFVYDLYELLMNNVLGIAVANAPDDRAPTLLAKDAIQPVGFGRDEGLVDYAPRSFLGYRLLSEYFAFPEKFLFFDVTGLDRRALRRIGSRMELFFFLDRHLRDVERNVTRETFRIGCTPVANLFRKRAEPIRLTHTSSHYRVVPDARRPEAHEVYSVDRVVATSPDNERVTYEPFYSTRHALEGDDQRAFWCAERRPAGYVGGRVDHGTEVFLTLVDLDFRPSAPADWTVDVETTCLSRDLPGRLPFGGSQPHLQIADGAATVRTRCLTPPTATLRPPLGHGTMWRLISHLSLNHLSLVDSRDGADALREILELYDYVGSATTRAMIRGLVRIESRRVVGRVGGGVSAGFCRGLEVTLQFDEEKFAGSGVFLFAAVLERFLALYTSLNSFTKFTATSKQRPTPIRQWPPRAGEQPLL